MEQVHGRLATAQRGRLTGRSKRNLNQNVRKLDRERFELTTWLQEHAREPRSQEFNERMARLQIVEARLNFLKAKRGMQRWNAELLVAEILQLPYDEPLPITLTDLAKHILGIKDGLPCPK